MTTEVFTEHNPEFWVVPKKDKEGGWIGIHSCFVTKRGEREEVYRRGPFKTRQEALTFIAKGNIGRAQVLRKEWFDTEIQHTRTAKIIEEFDGVPENA